MEDLEVPESTIAVSEILISEIARISLQSNTTLIEEGDSLDLLVTAFTSAGVEFDDDQYQFMNFDIETENTIV